MKECPNCQSLNRSLANFCKRCGLLLVDRCPRCQESIGDEADFCDNCGLALTPKAQFSWFQGSTKTMDKPWSEEPDLAADRAMPISSSPALSPIQKFIPRELAAKLEAARSRGDMVGERRVVTMLFCDVKGSTTAAENLDPEDWTEIINGAFEHMIKPVYKYEGTVARLMGDGILAFFGAPIAHEDDPQRAILSGLEIVEGIKQYGKSVNQRYGIDFDVRVGINTGRVVVGTVGSDMRMEYSAMGDAINLAARMEQTATPGTVQIAEDTYRLVSPLFEFENLGGIEVKGKIKPVPAFHVLGRKAVPGRLRGIEGLEAPLIGRETEWTQLVGAVEAVQKGVGQIIFLIGEAGLGKSRLIRELHSEIGDQGAGIRDQGAGIRENASAIQVNSPGFKDEDYPAVLHSSGTNPRSPIPGPQPPVPNPQWYETSSLSYESAQPYSLVRRLIQHMCGIQHHDPARSIRYKLEALVDTLPDDNRSQFRQVFESLLALRNQDGRPLLEGESFKGQLYVVTEALWRHQASISPIVLVCDDLHWTDKASVELLQHLLSLSNNLPVLFICALRPDRYSPGWELKKAANDRYAHRTTELTLRPLTNEDSNKLIDSLLTIADLPISLRENIMAKAEGNPFFVEEVIRTLIDSGDVIRDESGAHWVARNDGSEVEIPENLQALLITRIDQLEEQPRQVLQIASLIGRNFYYRVLERVLAMQTSEGNGQGPAISAELTEDLTTLQVADLIREVARIPELEYVFRHGLTQEAAYRTILRKLRREYHRMVGEVIEELFADHLEEHASNLARHFQEASDEDRAVRYYTLAGDVAFRLFALAEAIEHYCQALVLSDPLTTDKDNLVHLYLRRGRAYELIDSYDEALEDYAELERLAEDREDESLKMAALLARTIVHSTFTPVFDPQLGLPLAEEAITLARKLDDFAAEAKILWGLMLVHAFALGDLDAGANYGQQALALARQHQLNDQLPYILNDLGRIMGFNGQINEGLPLIIEARPLFEESGNLPLLCDNLSAYSVMNLFSGNLALAEEMALEVLRIARSINNRFGIEDGIGRVSAIYAEQGEFGRALEGVESIISGSEAVQHKIMNLPALSYIYIELDAAGSIPARFEAVKDQVDVAGPIFRIMFLSELIRLYLYLEKLPEAEKIWRELELDIEQLKLSPLNMPLFLAYAELLIARQQYEQAIALLEKMSAKQEEMGCYWYWADVVLLWAKGLLLEDPPRKNQARVVLENACTWIREMGIKRVLWKALLTLAGLVDEDEAGPLRREAQEIVSEIAEGIEDPDLRQSFLNRPEIKSNLSVYQ